LVLRRFAPFCGIVRLFAGFLELFFSESPFGMDEHGQAWTAVDFGGGGAVSFVWPDDVEAE